MPPMIMKNKLIQIRKNLKKFKEDIMENAKSKLKQWEVKKMGKKDVDEILDLEDRETVDSEEPTEQTEPAKEESKLQLITSEQLTQYKLDNLSLDVQDLNSRLQELIEVLRKKK